MTERCDRCSGHPAHRAPHHPPYTYQRSWNRKGKGIDVLPGIGMRMLRRPSALWPDALMMLGGQL